MSRWVKVVLPLSLMAVLSFGCGVCGQLPRLPLSGGAGNNGQAESATAVAPDANDAGGQETTGENNSEGSELVTTVTPSEINAGEEGDIPAVSAGLDALDSYVAHFKMTVKDSENDQEALSYEMKIESVRDPAARRIELQSDDPSEDSLVFVRIGDQQYFVYGKGGCVVSSVGEDEEDIGQIFKPDDFIGDVSSARRVMPNETINGIRCRHYRFDQSGFNGGGLSQAAGEAWVAIDGKYVVKFAMTADGKSPTNGEEGHMVMEYELTEVNTPLTIEKPEGCIAPSESEFPMMPDATDMQSVGGTIIYSSQSTVEEIVTFYREQMPTQGWSEGEGSFTSADASILSFVKNGDTVSISISADDGKTAVAIVSQ